MLHGLFPEHQGQYRQGNQQHSYNSQHNWPDRSRVVIIAPAVSSSQPSTVAKILLLKQMEDKPSVAHAIFPGKFV